MTEEAAQYVGADHYCETAQDGVDRRQERAGGELTWPTMQGPPNPLFLERMGRIQTAIHCGTPDRVPLSLVLDTFACNTMGVKYSEFCADLDVAGQTMLAATEKLGDVDSVQWATYAPAMLGMLWLAPMKLPGRDLPDDALWQLDEQVRIQPEDYDRIVEMGWGPWFGQYIGKYLGEAAAAGAAMQQKAPRWVGEFMGRGYVVFSASTVDHPYEHLCGGRTIQEFTMDLFTRPDKVEAAMQAIMAEKREQTRQMVRAIGPFGYWVGSWRTAPQFLSPKLWDRFVWPYMKELVEIVAEEGGIPMLHYDADWDREIERLLELPARTCVLATDGADRPLPRQEDPRRPHVPDGRRAAGHARRSARWTTSRPTATAC